MARSSTGMSWRRTSAGERRQATSDLETVAQEALKSTGSVGLSTKGQPEWGLTWGIRQVVGFAEEI